MGVKSWEVILRADAAPRDSRDGQKLLELAERAAQTVANQLRQRKKPTVVVYPGLLHGMVSSESWMRCRMR